MHYLFNMKKSLNQEICYHFHSHKMGLLALLGPSVLLQTKKTDSPTLS